MAQVRIEAFIKDIQENLYRGAEFLKHSVSHDQYVDDYKVHVPQAGSGAAVQKNRAQLPATVVERLDDSKDYTLDEYTTDPIVIRNIETIQLSYDKRMSVMKDFINLINQQIGDDGAYNWGADVPSLANGGIYLTTGTQTALSAAFCPGLFLSGATGSRRLFQLTDILQLQNKLNRDNVPQEGRHLLIPTDMWNDLMSTNSTILGSKLYQPDEQLIVDGSLAKIFGFNIWQRPTVNTFSGSNTPVIKAVGSAGAATDSLGCIAWQEDVVAKAQGAVKFFANTDRAEYFGSLYSALVMFHNTLLRSDAKGVAMLVQAT